MTPKAKPKAKPEKTHNNDTSNGTLLPSLWLIGGRRGATETVRS